MVLLLKSNIKHIRMIKKCDKWDNRHFQFFRTWFGYLEWLARFYLGKKALTL